MESESTVLSFSFENNILLSFNYRYRSRHREIEAYTDTGKSTQKSDPNGNLCWSLSLCSMNTYEFCIGLGVGKFEHTIRVGRSHYLLLVSAAGCF